MSLMIIAAILLFSLSILKLKFIDRNGALLSALLLLLPAIFGHSKIADPLSILLTYAAVVLMSAYRKHDRKAIYHEVGQRERPKTVMNVVGKVLPAIIASIAFPAEVLVTSLAYGIADSAGSQIGVFSKKQPRLITTFRRVAPGTNGAVSLMGTLLGIALGVLLGLAYGLFAGNIITFAVFGLVGSLFGNMIDSLLGATIEEKFSWPDWQINLVSNLIIMLVALLIVNMSHPGVTP